MVRSLRIPGVYQTVGAMHFTLIWIAVWVLGARVLKGGAPDRQRLVVAGGLLVAPFALIALLWVGLGTPWDATPTENRLRYVVLLAGSIAVASAFIVLKEALTEAGERLYSTLGFATNLFAGAVYLVWLCMQIGVFDMKVRDGQVPPMIISLSNMLDILLFVGCVLTYITTAGFAASMGRVRWLGRGATRAYVVASVVAVVFIAVRGLSFPDPTADATPWYLRPGFIAGIPAVPWIMPFLLGVVLLRRAGDEPRQ